MRINIISPLFKSNRTKDLSFGVNKLAITKALEKDTVQRLSPKKCQMLKREQKILELSLEGKTQKEIGEVVDLGLSTVNKIARKFDAFQQGRKKRNEEIIQRMINGEKAKDIAKDYRMSHRTIEEIASNNQAFKKYRELRNKKILEMLKEGYLAVEIAAELGISDATVSRVAHENGLFLKKKKSILKSNKK